MSFVLCFHRIYCLLIIDLLQYLRAVEAGQQPLVRGRAVVQLPDLGEPVEVGVHGEVVRPAEARHHDLVVQVTLLVHGHPGVTGGAGSHGRRHKVTGQRRGQLCRSGEKKSELK